MRRPVARDLVDVVLVGGGHAHIQVLRDFAMRPPPGVRLTVVVDTPIAVYSGMVPGFVAGQYERSELEIDVVPLARLAGARVLLAPASAIDPAARRVELAGRPAIPFDLVSLDIGSTVVGLDTPGVAEHCLPTRPIGEFVRTVEDRVARASGAGPVRVAVVGAGAGGVELAFALSERLRSASLDCEVSLVEAGPRILQGYAERLAARVHARATEKGVRVLLHSVVSGVGPGHLLIGGERVAADLVLWVAGAAPNLSFDPAGLPVDERGFISIRETLQIDGLEGAFAVGDCATLTTAPWVPRAGVYAVRQGPVLADNLRRAVSGAALRSYRPQRDFLTLLNLGDGTAIGTKWGRVFAGARAFRLKDRIDRRFMEKFQVLDPAGRVTPEFHLEARMRAEMDVLCGGCAAKLGQSELERVLERLGVRDLSAGVEVGVGDDAAVVHALDGTRIVSSIDQFRAITDDPWLTGRVGAVNAASDVLAKGVAPRYAQAVIALPEAVSVADREELLFQVMDGARTAFDELGVDVIGGHTTTASELMVGFHVEGYAGDSENLLTLDRLGPDQTLVLTKALGTGALFRADMQGRARGTWLASAIDSMLLANAGALPIARDFGATAATDVTGFGLAQHVATMLRASDLAAEIDVGSLPALPGVAELLSAGLRSTFHDENARAARGMDFGPGTADHPLAPLLFDPQTSGGLVFGVPGDDADDAVAALRAVGYSDAAAIGSTKLFSGVRLEVVVGR
ncbi:MAG: selenide, water dikinase SelD [Gemmatimonadota bacterium]|nr:selenide, water dikinase SelD [Gemmatimonadota bacterium]